ncbi:MAG: WD40 repeat protein [Sphingomonas echinoides]|jgi:WD40 repeat protein
MSANPPTYPESGTYADLLLWHLEVWWTRPGGSPTQRGATPWDIRAFKDEVFKDDKGVDPDGPYKKYRSYTGKYQKYPPSEGKAKIISRLLFNGEVQFKRWENDLKEARIRSAGKGNNIANISISAAIAKLEKALAEEAAHSEELTKQLPEHLDAVTFTHRQTHKFKAEAARQNSALVAARLTSFFAGRSSDLKAIEDFVNRRMAGGSQGLLVIAAPAGFGKSALAARWCHLAEMVANRRVVRHFCSTSTGQTTTSLENIYAHLHYQVATVFNEPIDQAGDFDALVALLAKAPPDGQHLVLWLDGIDEANGTIECFLPAQLGERVCVIVTARADDAVIPPYLAPWLQDDMARFHRPVRQSLAMLPFDDVEELVDQRFDAEDLVAPDGLAERIFRSSGSGYPLFVRYMAESAVESAKTGENVDLGETQGSLIGFAEAEFRRLKRLERWPDFQPIFAFLTLAREAMPIDEMSTLIGNRIFPDALPPQLMRWLTLVESADRRAAPLLSFAHPLLAHIFGQAIGYQQQGALTNLCKKALVEPFSEWPRYAFRHLPEHLAQANSSSDLATLLSDPDFISARLAALGPEDCPQRMLSDWKTWVWKAKDDWLLQIADSSDPMRHLRFWENYHPLITHATALEMPNAWRQLMHDSNLIHGPEYSPVIGCKRSELTSSLVALGRQEMLNNAIALEDGAGILSWSRHALQLWGPSADERAPLLGHDGWVHGALALEGGAGFLSWSEDSTLRLWGPAGEVGPALRGHAKPVRDVLALKKGAGFLSRDMHDIRLWSPFGVERAVMRHPDDYIDGIAILEGGTGFLSWSSDGELGLWGPAGEERAVIRGKHLLVDGVLPLKPDVGFLSWCNRGEHSLLLWGPEGDRYERLYFGHDGDITGALALEDGTGFLTWSKDKTLQLWSSEGDERAVLRGHTDSVLGAFTLESAAGYLSWSDEEIILWDRDGEERESMRDHLGWIRGAIELKDGIGFLSWSDNAVTLWNRRGELSNIWLMPSLAIGAIKHVEPFGDSDRYLVLFGNNISVVHLPPIDE